MYLSSLGTADVRIDGTGSIRAAKRRCPLCGTSKLRSRGDGRVMCKNGHEQAGIVEEVTETMADSMTRRHIRKLKRESKRQTAQRKRMYGRGGRFLVLQIMQYILKEQATALVEELGAPESVLGTVRNLWLLYVSKLDGIVVPSTEGDDDLDGQTPANIAKKQRVSIMRSALANENNDGSLHSQQSTQTTQQTQAQAQTQTQTQDMLNLSQGDYDGIGDDDLAFIDESLNSLLQKIDDDIARDELEMLELNEYQATEGRLHKSQAVAADEEQSDESDQSDADQGSASKSRTVQESDYASFAKNSIYGGLLRHIETFVHLEYLPAILYLAFAWLRLPLTHAELFRLLADERVPYASAYQRLPEEITERIGKGFIGFINLKFSPSIARLRTITRGFVIFFQKHHSIQFSPVDTPVMLLHLIRRLGLGIGVYAMAMRLLELFDIQRMKFNLHRKKLELTVISAIIIVLKLHYGLDEIERQPAEPEETTGRSLGLPPLKEFLEKWREDWKRELLISTKPELTTIGSDWEAEFVEYCRRKMAKRKIPDYRAVYRDVAPRYRRLIESLACDGELDQEQARKLLPSQYLRHDLEAASKAESQAKRVPEVLRCIEPVLMPTVRQGQADDMETTPNAGGPSEYKTVFEPYDNHPEIKLKRGEMYVTGVGANAGSNSSNGYMLPTLGLIIARCADIVGYPRYVVLKRVTKLELCMCTVKENDVSKE